MEQIFIQLAIILLVAFVISYIVRLFKQPLIIGYIFAGIIISPFLIKFGTSTELMNTFSRFGIALLLFIVGLHMNPKVIKEIGIKSLFIGLGQVILTFALGFFVSLKLLNYGFVSSCYIGIGLSFSSTIIVLKLLSDKKNLDSLYGKISTGILIVQDIIAMGALMFISSMSRGGNLGSFALQGLLGGTFLIAILFFIGYFILPKIIKEIAKSQELLFLFSICWCFLIAALFSYLGFSIEIGALIAGIILSISPYSTEISSRIKPLRDFFLILFFIILGFNVQITNAGSIIINALILSGIVLIFKPLILMFLMGLFKYTKRTGFLVGTTLAQVSSFSLIILMLGASIGQVNSEVLHTFILTMIITIFFSTYMVVYAKAFYKKMKGVASLFERKNIKRNRNIKKNYDAILFGYNRVGFSILRSLRKFKKNYLVVDFNPDTISNLNKFNIPCLYGDVDDPELLEELPLDKVKIAISTTPDFETNFILVETIRLVNPDAIIILRAHTVDDALELYKKGANYVLTPHFLGGEYIGKMIKSLKLNGEKYEKEKERHIKILTNILEKNKSNSKKPINPFD